MVARARAAVRTSAPLNTSPGPDPAVPQTHNKKRPLLCVAPPPSPQKRKPSVWGASFADPTQPASSFTGPASITCLAGVFKCFALSTRSHISQRSRLWRWGPLTRSLFVSLPWGCRYRAECGGGHAHTPVCACLPWVPFRGHFRTSAWGTAARIGASVPPGWGVLLSHQALTDRKAGRGGCV